MIRAGTPTRFLEPKEPHLEYVRREVRLGHHFTGAEFERAFRSFIELYAVRPSAALCSPDVLERFCALYERAGNAHRSEVRFDGVRMTAAILPPGTIAFEGEVDQDRMGDW